MTFVAHGVTLALTWFLLAAALLSLAAATLGARLAGRAHRAVTPAPHAWFALRLCPSVGALGFVAVAFVPSYWRFEPRDAIEAFDVTLSLCALATLSLCVLGAARGVIAFRAVSRRTRDWLQTATPMSACQTGAARVPAFVIPTPAPLMALVGIIRPRVFVSAQLAAALTADELAATIAHELAHWRAADNLKRLAIRVAPDLLGGTSAADAIERRWASAAELSADHRGTSGDAARRCTLASALVKVARLMPLPAPVLEPMSTLVGGGDLASRVERLLAEPPPDSRRVSRPHLLAAGTAIAIAVAGYGPLLRAIHAATEVLVNSLP